MKALTTRLLLIALLCYQCRGQSSRLAMAMESSMAKMEALSHRFEEMSKQLNNKTEDMCKELNKKVEEMETRMNIKFGDLNDRMTRMEGVPCQSPSHHISTLGCLTPVLEEMIWEDAKKHCIDQGSRLLEKISTHAEMNELKEHFGDVFNNGTWKHHAWIGMRGSTWIEGGDLLDATSPLWALEDPDKEDSNCVHIYLGASPPVLYDHPCSTNRLHSLCQRVN